MKMIEVYPKFYAPYIRGKFSKFIDLKQPRPEIQPYMNDETEWTVSEKLDGTNTRIIWDGYKLKVKGRTSASQLQGFQQELLAKLTENGNYVFDELFGEKPVTIFGETIGEKIQKNPYNVTGDFLVFDILIDNVWLTYDQVKEYSEQLGLHYNEHHSIRGWDNVLTEFEDRANDAEKHNFYFEGLVAVPYHMPLDRLGNRVITKIKVADFEQFH